MRRLRYFLLVASLAVPALVFYGVVISRHAHPLEFILALAFAAGGILNFVYVLRCPPTSK
jgi:hypothetical protein